MLFNLNLFSHVLGTGEPHHQTLKDKYCNRATWCGGRREAVSSLGTQRNCNPFYWHDLPGHWSLMNWLSAREDRSVAPDLNPHASLPFTLFSSAYLAHPYLPCLPPPLGLSFHLWSSLQYCFAPLYHSSQQDSTALNPKFLKHSDIGILAWGWWRGCQFK